ncbi:MAG: hypothetical protein RR285_05725 [Acinetobacter sp.]
MNNGQNNDIDWGNRVEEASIEFVSITEEKGTQDTDIEISASVNNPKQLDLAEFWDKFESHLQKINDKNEQIMEWQAQEYNLLCRQSEENKSTLQTIDEQQNLIQKQQAVIQKFQDDLLFKTQKPLLLEMINIADNVRMFVNDQKNKSSEERNFDELLREFEKIGEWIDASLEDNSVKKYEDSKEDNQFNCKRQEIVETIETEVQELNDTIVPEQPGYIWTMPYLIIDSETKLIKVAKENEIPQKFSYIIKSEEVKKYKYRKIICQESEI